MTLNDFCQERLDELEGQHLKRTLQACPLNTRQLDFSSNDYLCLSQHPEVIEAGTRCAQTFGAGATGSRLLSGNLACFEALEHQLAEFKRSEAALVFSSGYQTNASALAALLDKTLWGNVQPLVFSDRLNHASLHAGCQLAGAKQIRFRHNDMAHLAELLTQHAEHPAPKVIVSETVFGMEGDLLPIEALASLALQHQALVFLDEAHATGVWGPEGRGLGAHHSPAIETLKSMGHWVIMGTFSKALGVSGAYIACSAAVKAYLINRCGGFVYSTAPSPFIIGAVSKALELIPYMATERIRLHTLAETVREHGQALGYNTGESNTHIVPLIVGSAEESLRLRNHLLSAGIRSSAVRPPTVPPHTARVRLALNVGHTEKTINILYETLSTAFR